MGNSKSKNYFCLHCCYFIECTDNCERFKQIIRNRNEIESCIVTFYIKRNLKYNYEYNVIVYSYRFLDEKYKDLFKIKYNDNDKKFYISKFIFQDSGIKEMKCENVPNEEDLYLCTVEFTQDKPPPYTTTLNEK